MARKAVEDKPWAEEDIDVESEDEMCTGTWKGTSHAQQADGYKAPYKTTAADRKTRMDRRAQRADIHALLTATEIAWTRLGEWRYPHGRGRVTPRRGNERGGEVGHVTPHHNGEQRQGPLAHVGL